MDSQRAWAALRPLRRGAAGLPWGPSSGASLGPAEGARPARPLLTVRRLAVRFGRLWALDGIDLDIQPGQLVALAGENGAGKSTLAGCIAGDIAPTSGEILLDGRPVQPKPRAASRRGIAFVRQHTELCDNLDVAANLFLGREGRRFFVDHITLYNEAVAVLENLKVVMPDVATTVGSLSGGTRQLLSVARAMLDKPRLLVLDEPTFSLGVNEAARVEELVSALNDQGTTVLLVSHDVDQMFRLADRIVVLRHGRVVADVDPRASHRDDVGALLSGQQVESSARRQLTRLQGLVGQLANTGGSSSLSVILSSLGGALRTKSLAVHLREGAVLRCAATLGLPAHLPDEWAQVPYGSPHHPVGRASVSDQVVVDDELEPATWSRLRSMTLDGKVESCWAVPVTGATGLIGVITIMRPTKGRPERDELDLARLYAGYAASAVERERLLTEATTRNRVLETIREVLETLAGRVSVPDALALAVRALRRGLQADGVVLVTRKGGDPGSDRKFADGSPAASLAEAPGWLDRLLTPGSSDGRAKRAPAGPPGGTSVAVAFHTDGGLGALVAHWSAAAVPEGSAALMENAAHSLQLALEREAAELAHQEAAALRRSQEMQQGFLSRLSHELRTPLTAIRGYASSLLQTDVTWDAASKQRFLNSVAVESARLGRLVEDLLDFSAIESGLFRLQSDWCEVPLVFEAAAECLPPAARANVELAYEPGLPVVWADHDRLEQVLLNLLDNAVRHNPPGTQVKVVAHAEGAVVAIDVLDEGDGLPADIATALFDPKRRRRTPTAGAGLGLSIARGIVLAHGGTMEVRPLPVGTGVFISLPIEGVGRAGAEASLSSLTA